MKDLGTFFLVGSGGFIGANARYWLGALIQQRLGPAFPWHTLIVNMSGSLVMGLFMGMMLDQNPNSNWRLLIAVGVLGGYTTFSAFSYESITLLSNGEIVAALSYILASVILSIFSTWVGIAIVRIAAPA